MSGWEEADLQNWCRRNGQRFSTLDAPAMWGAVILRSYRPLVASPSFPCFIVIIHFTAPFYFMVLVLKASNWRFSLCYPGKGFVSSCVMKYKGMPVK